MCKKSRKSFYDVGPKHIYIEGKKGSCMITGRLPLI